MQALILLGVFGAVFAVSLLVLNHAATALQISRRLRRREESASEGGVAVLRERQVRGGFLGWVQSAKFLQDAADEDRTRTLLVQAGFEGVAAPVWFTIARFGLATILPTIFLLGPGTGERGVGLLTPFIAAALCAAGLVAPRMLLERLAEARRAELEQQFPDALDLMVVCVEAGLGMEAAFMRVAREVRESHPRVARELDLVSQELRAGRTRAEALRNLGERTAVPAVRSFAALLIQTDTLGASIGQTLRVYSKELRETRFMNAEEKAMRIPVLMTIPLVACILPVIMTALLLPGIIDVIRVGLPALRGAGG
ncbi:MAG: type II secretion system F family protein [Phenylobacterium sp.]|uniref:type II secretion system F family protein n=1 Tax=Phenylobacterium sp. TaxID=1871053 RepID=UPI0039192474